MRTETLVPVDRLVPYGLGVTSIFRRSVAPTVLPSISYWNLRGMSRLTLLSHLTSRYTAAVFESTLRHHISSQERFGRNTALLPCLFPSALPELGCMQE